MADAKKLLRALLPKAYKMEDGELESLLSDSTTDEAGIELVLNKDKTRISELSKPKAGQTFQDGYKKGKAESLTELEKGLKEKFEIQSEAQGVELVEEIVTTKTKAAGKAKELTDDDVRKHKVYQDAEKANKIALKAKETEWETKYNTREAEFKKGEAFSTVSKKALDIVNKLNPVLPKNPTVAANLQNAFLQTLKSMDFEIQENGNRIIPMKEGKVMQDAHGHTVDFEKMVQEQAAGYFEFQANNGGSNSGNGNPNEQGAGSGNSGANPPKYPAGVVKPKTWDELNKIVNDTNIKAEDRAIVLQTWETEQKAGTPQ
jgi:hypothetical protein